MRATALIAAPPIVAEAARFFLREGLGVRVREAKLTTNVSDNGWYLWSSHGVALFYIAINPHCTIAQIAEDLCLTQRTIWGVVGDLRRAEMLHVERVGRRHHYRVNLDATFRHPTIENVSLRTLLGNIPAAMAAEDARELVGVAAS